MKTAAVDIKGSTLSVLVLRVNEIDQVILFEQLAEKIAKGSALLTRIPYLIDMDQVDEDQQKEFDLIRLVEYLRSLGVTPVAVRGAGAHLENQAVQTGLGVLPAPKQQVSTSSLDIEDEGKEDQQETNQEESLNLSAVQNNNTVCKTKIITRTIRSGQQVFAPGDLIVLSSVNAGAEVLARGNIHVYGTLRGRALAGIEGDESAAIFCAQCNPELVAVAGNYMVNESLDRKVINQSVMISLDDDGLIFNSLGLRQANI